MPGDIEELSRAMARIEERVKANSDLMEAKFVTFDVMMKSQAEKVALALASVDKANVKQEQSDDKRFDLLNELRSDVATHAEVDTIEKQLEDLKTRLDRMEGVALGGNARTADVRASVFIGLGILGAIMTIVVFVANLITSKP